MARRAIGRVASAIVVASGWLLAGARGVLDLIGYSTVPEDVVVAQTALGEAFTWFLGLPWWLTWGFAFASTFWLVRVSWPRERPTAISTTPVPQIEANDGKIDPWVAAGQRTYAKVNIDVDNWRAEAVEKENIHEVRVLLADEEHKDIEIVVIFDRWVPNPGLKVQCDRRGEGYRTEQVALDDRYAICRLYNIKIPCVVELDFD